jgi:PPOX class probable F420-dependent enzyme
MDPQAVELLEAPNFAHVSTIRKDGSPHAALTWVDVEGDEVHLNSAEGRVWPANLRRDGRITLLVADKENPYRYAMIRGRLAGEDHETADDHINHLAKKYLGQDEYPFRQPGEQRVRFRITPEHVSVHGG